MIAVKIFCVVYYFNFRHTSFPMGRQLFLEVLLPAAASETPSNYMYVVHLTQQLDLFSRFCRARGHDGPQTDSQTVPGLLSTLCVGL